VGGSLRRVACVLLLVALGSLGGCAELVGASIDAGFRSALDHGSHPLYEHKSYGEHFLDALADQDDSHGEVEVEVHTRHERHERR